LKRNWTEILAPLPHDGAHYVALRGKGGSEVADSGADKLNALFRSKIEADPATYGKLTPTVFGVGQGEIARPARPISCSPFLTFTIG
jgi:hypothetical protein